MGTFTSETSKAGTVSNRPVVRSDDGGANVIASWALEEPSRRVRVSHQDARDGPSSNTPVPSIPTEKFAVLVSPSPSVILRGEVELLVGRRVAMGGADPADVELALEAGDLESLVGGGVVLDHVVVFEAADLDLAAGEEVHGDAVDRGGDIAGGA